MKSNLKIIITIVSLFIGSIAFAQLTEPGGDDGSAPGDSGIAGGGAPIGSGLALVIGLGLAYGTKKTYQLSQEEK